MTKPKKTPIEMTTNQALRKIFGGERAKLLKEISQELDAEKPKKKPSK